MPGQIENVIPILNVADLGASIDYYTRCLGFVVDWRDGAIGSVSRDGHSIMLCQDGQGQPGAWLWMGVADAQALFEEFSSRGANILLPPTNYPWALEMRVSDPDGHVLRVGSEPLSDIPLA